MFQLIEDYKKALQAIYDHVGFTEDWVVCPIDDKTEHYWYLSNTKGAGFVIYIEEDRQNLKQALENLEYYKDEIYTQRFYKKWVYRGEDFTLVMCNPGVDGMKWFTLFDNKLQIFKWDYGNANVAYNEIMKLKLPKTREQKLKRISQKANKT